MSNEPTTYNEVMAWFGTGHRAGSYDLHCLSMLLDHAAERDPEFTTPERIWCHVLDYGLLQRDSTEFWVTPRGKVWNVQYAGHEILFHVTDMIDSSITLIERAGWLRVSSGSALHCTPITRVQRETLARRRPDLDPRMINETKKVPLKTSFDCPELKMPWTVWVPEVDARPE